MIFSFLSTICYANLFGALTPFLLKDPLMDRLKSITENANRHRKTCDDVVFHF